MGLLTWLWRRRAIEADLDDEIRSHFQMASRERMAQGEDAESARLAATRDFGNALQMKEEARDVWRGRIAAVLADAWQDSRFAARISDKCSSL